VGPMILDPYQKKKKRESYLSKRTRGHTQKSLVYFNEGVRAEVKPGISLKRGG